MIPQLFDERRQTFDLDLRYRFDWLDWHEITLGLSYRRTRDETGGPPIVVFVDPLDRSTDRPGAFLQDRMSFLDGRLKFTIGSKIEHNDFTGTELQPSIRLGYSHSERTFLAFSLARAVRTPNRLEEDVALFCSEGLQALTECNIGDNFVIGNPDLSAEKLTAAEFIVRHQFSSKYSIDLALFSNRYKDLTSNEPDPQPFGFIENRLEADSWGGEISLKAQVLDKLTLSSWLSFLDLSVDDSRSNDEESRNRIEGSSPDFQASLALRWSPGPWQIDAVGRYVDELSFRNDAGEEQTAKAYGELDLRLARRFGPALSIGLLGRNLLNSSHLEFPDSTAEMERAVLLEVIWEPGAGR